MRTASLRSRSATYALLLVACLGSVATLLGFLYGIAPMHVLGAVVLVPSLLLIGVVWRRAWRSGDSELHLRLLVGFWGGVWGTLGYDLARIPLHYLGFNPFPPIRSYGMYVTASQNSTLLSDVAGVVYHFSNGITFGWIYALLLARRSFGWAVVWGLLLETLAVVSPFGSVYGIRAAYAALSIAYVAHLFYGLPLGAVCERPESTAAWLSGGPGARRRAVSLGTLALVAVFLCTAWEKPWSAPDLAPATIQLGPNGVARGWTRVTAGSVLTIVNADNAPVTWVIRATTMRGTAAPGQQVQVPLEQPGLFQLVTEDRRWRSVMISVERNGYPFHPRRSVRFDVTRPAATSPAQAAMPVAPPTYWR